MRGAILSGAMYVSESESSETVAVCVLRGTFAVGVGVCDGTEDGFRVETLESVGGTGFNVRCCNNWCERLRVVNAIAREGSRDSLSMVSWLRAFQRLVNRCVCK
jgi:hypothetical protein